MQIVCPSCASRYEIDAMKLGPEGRKVRCAGCRTSWHVDPASVLPEPPSEDETRALLAEELERAAAIDAEITALAAEASEVDEPPAEVAPAEAPPAAAPRRRRSPAKPRRSAGLIRRRGAGLPAAAALAGLALLSLIAWQRDAAVRAAPQLAGLFDAIGMPVNLRGLSLSAVESGLVEDGQNRFLVVEGDVTNITRARAAVPLIEVAVKDAGGTTLYSWTTEPPRASLEPAELVRFRARLASPPEQGQSVRVRFASADRAGTR
ncbi:zinc-ribbon domain-containing protein [Bosea sp. (in: a-proteobacteria)]|uniref:zinc-ribbon domain-containing protein n=1 Tax=Bosea sp. (in: a-proteobacteria) TaxID=1871050 RepID=UPI0026222193|nr:zinc-ribbon domain-containing protein [Bosea sp. (in: a-proteobacteria)]MCO5090780.1 zinc-ribbon domain-containing protein [Bosea sp. (in: a-proteobacteria)]